MGLDRGEPLLELLHSRPDRSHGIFNLPIRFGGGLEAVDTARQPIQSRADRVDIDAWRRRPLLYFGQSRLELVDTLRRRVYRRFDGVDLLARRA